MRKLLRLVVRVVFWSYERGSLPYALMVIAILIFVLLAARGWFNDQPSLHAPAVAGQIRLVDVDTATRTELFRIDANLLAPPGRTRELEKETHELLKELAGAVRELVGRLRPARSARRWALVRSPRARRSARSRACCRARPIATTAMSRCTPAPAGPSRRTGRRC